MAKEITVEEMVKKIFSYDSYVDMENRTVRSTISTPTLDREHEVILSTGIQYKKYLDNMPIVLWNHDRDRVLGKCIHIDVDENGMHAVTQFTPRPPDHEGEWFPDTILTFMEHGAVRGCSTTILPDKNHVRCTKKDKMIYGPTLKRLYGRGELMEYSIVALPANGECFAKSLKESGLDEEYVKKELKIEVEEIKDSKIEEKIEEITEEVVENEVNKDIDMEKVDENAYCNSEEDEKTKTIVIKKIKRIIKKKIIKKKRQPTEADMLLMVNKLKAGRLF